MIKNQTRQLYNLFACPLIEAEVECDNDEILSYCYSIKKSSNGRNISNVGGFQSTSITYDDASCSKKIKVVINAIKSLSIDACKALDIEYLKIVNYWININGNRDFNWTHTHYGSVMSAVYYVKTPENCGNIEFENPAINGMNRDTKLVQQNKYFSCNWSVPVKAGKIYLFPSWLRHGVSPNLNETEDRVSIAFNLIH